MGTPTTHTILFGTIPTDILVTTPVVDPLVIHNDTLVIPTETTTLPAIPDTPPTIAIPFGRPYRTQPNGVCMMLTVRKRVRPLPSHRLDLRYPSDHSSPDHFSSHGSSPDSSSDLPSDYSSDT
ncbi:hypothetical protein Tco_0767478 [Tanacetum coccineum]